MIVTVRRRTQCGDGDSEDLDSSHHISDSDNGHHDNCRALTKRNSDAGQGPRSGETWTGRQPARARARFKRLGRRASDS
jgi:hypothetical protein